MKTKPIPPKFACWLLKRFLLRNEDSEKLGDLEEGYWIKFEEDGILSAYLWYWKQALLAIPVSIKNSITWGGIMLQNYIKIAIRNIKKYKAYSAINILGLAAGMACCILILLWVQDELSYDGFHENGENIYRVIPTVSGNPWISSPWALIGNLKRDYPEIEKASWYFNAGVSTNYGEKTFRERIALVAPDFLEMFTFPFISGDHETALRDINSVIISERTAVKYFGNEDPIGKTLNLEDQVDLTITGIIYNVPLNSHMQFDLVARPEVFISTERMQTWSMDCPSYIMLSDGANYDQVVSKISDSIDRYDKRGVYDCTIGLQPLGNIYLYSLTGTNPIMYVYIFSGVAVLVLLIASINFMNLSTARSALRAKEIGMRKVIGAKRSDVIKQFFSESIILSFFALFAALILVALLLPTFNTLTDKQLEFEIIGNFNIALLVISVAIITGILSGIYPSIYLSSFQPVTILKSQIVKGNKNQSLRRGLIIFQFAAAISLIISTAIILKQINYISTKDLGFNRENVVIINLNDELLSKYEALKQEIKMHKNIINVSAACNLPLSTRNNTAVRWDGMKDDKPPMINFVSADFDYFETLEMEMKYGRSFSKEYPTDKDNYILNETALKMTGYVDPIGSRFVVDGNEGIIIGVVKDFHGTSLRNEINPTFFMMKAYAAVPKSRMFIRINSNNIPETIEYIEKSIYKFSPHFIFQFNFMDDFFDRIYRSEQNLQSLLKYFTILAILISCLGLLGLASFIAERRTKEIAIRKVLGAKTPSLMVNLCKEFVMLVIIANIIAWPIAYYFMSGWIESFTYRTDIGVIIFILSAVIAIGIAIITVSFQAFKAANRNPVDSLKHE
ncbi:ABC transporter permease [Bacteroidota bacterium]